MLERMVHRGPDDSFLVSGEKFTLGARRLSIIDVEGGRQPLSNENATVWACQNGELYNFEECRAELEADGHRFRTRSDTEILPHLYETHGESFARRLRGMFAVAIWDDARGQGVLARDHAGKKPLHYVEHRGALYFASEIQALLAVPDLDRAPNPQAIHHFLSYKHVPAPLTAFRGIFSLPPATTLLWRDDAIVGTKKYWTPSFAADAKWDGASEEDVACEVLSVLETAVSDRLISDVPIGFYLSGGLDSSLSTAIAASKAPGRIETFTLAYDEGAKTPGKDEDRAFAREVASRYGTSHHEEIIGIDDFASEFRTAQQCFGGPFSGVTSSYFLARLIGRHVKVALSGDGADELFGSYLSHRIAGPVDAYVKKGDAGLPPGLAEADLVRRIASPDMASWRSRLFVFSEPDKQRIYGPEMKARTDLETSAQHFRGYLEGATATDPLNLVLEAEFRGFLPDQVLTFVDRLSMAHSLETRTAYLDPRMIELAASLPARLKIRDGDVKRILKRAAKSYLPEALISRPKEGFVMPVNTWLLDGLAPFVDETLRRKRVAEAGLLDPDGVEAVVTSFRTGETTAANKVLSILALQVWWESYFGAERCF